MDHLVEQSRQLAWPRQEPSFSKILEQHGLAPSTAAHHERDPDEPSGPDAN